MPGKEERVRRVGQGVLLKPVGFDMDAWWAKLDSFAAIPFMEEGRQQCPMPDDKHTSFDE